MSASRPEILIRKTRMNRFTAYAATAPLSFAALCFAGACAEGNTSGEAVFTPEVNGTASVPLSDNSEVALLADGRVACVIESYEDRVHCVDREGGRVGSFGRAGDGPGEFGGAAALVRGDRETIGVVDYELSRFSVFEPSGAFVSSVASVKVRDRMVSFDLVGSTLVVLVERRLGPEDADGVPDRAMDWYEVGRVG